MHMWGDEWFEKYGDDLHAAEDWLHEELKRRTWCTLLSKEKYGTIRYEHVVAPKSSPYFISYEISTPLWFFPKKYEWGNLPRWRWNWSESRICKYWEYRAWKVLWKLVREAVKKWPHLEVELMQDFAWHKEIVGEEIHGRYWRSV